MKKNSKWYGKGQSYLNYICYCGNPNCILTSKTRAMRKEILAKFKHGRI